MDDLIMENVKKGVETIAKSDVSSFIKCWRRLSLLTVIVYRLFKTNGLLQKLKAKPQSTFMDG